ncbi:hypothetical protein C900_00053 [Fulvivirga imtechensis AK7]|uniref:Uncharacterized protein n=1 Tax=Fulvivirga imtechensis AK7 TaxID=1237149 RepID=L8K1S7_9BACT|nr:hypothetical protein [Fulvivirga imtechensis]ELR73889.1 hypothetical protein C900_00053 [Fulvivirga imtechensis AK7]
MNTKSKVPYKVSEYIRDTFREEFLCSIKSYTRDGKTYYLAEVTKDDLIHHLKFDEKGQLMKDDADPAFPPDIHDESFKEEGLDFEDY